MNLIIKLKNQDKYTKYSIYIIILFALIVLSLTSFYHVSGDGCWHLSAGKYITENKKIPMNEPLGRQEPFWSPPLYHILAAAVYFVFNSFSHNAANSAVKFISPIFGILSLIFSFLLIKKLYNSKIAFYSVIFLAFIPIFIDYSVLSYVESLLVFFTVLSVYLLVNGKTALSGISAGLAILTKYNGVFIVPVLLFIIYKAHYKQNKKLFYKNSMIIILLASSISLPWFIRNWALLGNPIWPFLNFLFDGYQAEVYSGITNSIRLSNLINPNVAIFTYLGIFGVPDGYYHAFSFIDIPFFTIFFIIWLLGTLIFIMPLLFGFWNLKKLKNNSALAVWIASYIVLMIFYIVNASWSVSRIILPAFPALSMIWAFGFDKLAVKYKIIFKTIIILIIIGMVFTLFFKFGFSAKSWDFYNEDFEWVKSNTAETSIFIANGQCLPYNIERTSLYATQDNIKKADYAFINQQFRLDGKVKTDPNLVRQIKQDFKLAYSNEKTGTEIYRKTG